MFWGSKRFHNSVRLLLIAPWWCHYNLVTLISLWLVDLWGLRPDGVHSRLHLHHTGRCHLRYVAQLSYICFYCNYIYIYFFKKVLASDVRICCFVVSHQSNFICKAPLIQISGAQWWNGTSFECKSKIKTLLCILSLPLCLNLELESIVMTRVEWRCIKLNKRQKNKDSKSKRGIKSKSRS